MSDKLARVLTGLAVLAVAVIAAAVSFAHIQALALAHGYTADTGWLLPLSVDGLIVASSLTLLTEARANRDAPRLARFGLVLGIAATVAANVAYGARYGVAGAVISGWPAASFLTATEILLGQMRRARTIPTRDDTALTVADVPACVPEGVPADVPQPVPASTVPTTGAKRARTVSSGRASGRRGSTPEKVFADELAAGQVPSLRAIKTRMACGTDRARVILADLQGIAAG